MRAIYSQWLNSNNKPLKLNNNNKNLLRGNVRLADMKKIAEISARSAELPSPSSTNGNANAAQSTKASSARNAANQNPSATNGLANAARSIKANSARNAASPETIKIFSTKIFWGGKFPSLFYCKEKAPDVLPGAEIFSD